MTFNRQSSVFATVCTTLRPGIMSMSWDFAKRSEKVGDRFKKNFDENLYGAEQMNVSYKRQPQPVDIAGTKKQSGSLKSIKSNSTSKAQKIMNQLESTEDKANKIIKEDLQKMMNLISYDRKTQ